MVWAFSQTALEFDNGGLFQSMHLSIVRALWVPVFLALAACGNAGGPASIDGALAVFGALRLAENRVQTVSGLSLTLLLLFPMTPVLATTDIRPLVWMYPAVVWIIVGLREDRPY